MRKTGLLSSFIFLAVMAGVILFAFYIVSPNNYISNLLASIFFTDSITIENLNNRYSEAKENNHKVKVLIVPGHDNNSWGTEFRGVKESEMTVQLGERLFELLSARKEFEVVLVRNQDGYDPVFSSYFRNERAAIENFLNKQKQTMDELLRGGQADPFEGVHHNFADSGTLLKLYGINRWANENKVDIVTHIHFNDYRRQGNQVGKYTGFAIYVPEKQYSNAKASYAVAQSIFNKLSKYYPISDLPQESKGIVEDQELIAVGSHNSLDAVGMVVEYGYIYESQFLNKNIRSLMLNELAFQTYAGILSFFESDGITDGRYGTSILPHHWESGFKYGLKNSEAVLAIQLALLFENMYPPAGFDKHQCPLSGNFGNCTLLAVKEFQKKYSIGSENGEVSLLTRSKLNELYSK